MRISIIGSNGLLSDSIGHFYGTPDNYLELYGLAEPKRHAYNEFHRIDLMRDEFNYPQIKESDIIIYAVGAGIQSNMYEPPDVIYNLNVHIPIKVCCFLKSIDYSGVFVTFGSYFEIGENNEDKSYTEEDILFSMNKVVNDYSISKRLLTRFSSSFSSSFKIWHLILPTIYGENESKHRLIPSTLKALDNNLNIRFTSGEQIRQYIYVGEIPVIINLAVEKKLPHGIYNIMGNETLSVKDLVSILFDCNKKKLPESVFGGESRADTGMKMLKLDGNKLQKIVDYTPAHKIIDVYDKYQSLD